MMTFEIDQKQTFSSVDLLIGIEQTLLQKNILSGQATAKRIQPDEILFQDSQGDLCTHVKIYLKPISQLDLEMFQLDQMRPAGEMRQQLILIYPDLEQCLTKSFKGHCRRVMHEHKCHALTAYEYIPLRSQQDEQAIALKETVSLQQKSAATLLPLLIQEPLSSLLNDTEESEIAEPGTYNFYRQAALSGEELSEFLDLGVTLRKKA